MKVTNKINIYGLEGKWPDHVSSSQRGYWSCRLRAAFGTALGLRKTGSELGKSRAYGSVIHAALGQHYSTVPGKRSEKILQQAADAHLDVVVDQIKPDDVERVTIAVVQTLRRFWANFGDDGIVAKSIEHQLKVPLAGSDVHYLGYTDMEYTSGEQYIVEEWKSSMSAINPAQYTLYNPQGVDYVWAAEQQKRKNVRLSYLLLSPSSVRRILVPFVDTSTTESELLRLATEERTLPIVPNYSRGCQWCDYSSICTTKITGGDVEAAAKAYKKASDVQEEGESDDAE